MREVRKMVSAKTYFKISGVIFFIVGLLHLLRLFTGWTVILDGFTIPLWVSVLGVLFAWFLAYSAWILAGKGKSKK
jgi:hypothetical protein